MISEELMIMIGLSIFSSLVFIPMIIILYKDIKRENNKEE